MRPGRDGIEGREEGKKRKRAAGSDLPPCHLSTTLGTASLCMICCLLLFTCGLSLNRASMEFSKEG